MKALKRAVCPLLLLLLLASSISPGITQPDQVTFTAFSWEGLSLDMTPAQMTSALESQGYTALPARDNPQNTKRVSAYNRKTATASNKVQITEKEGVLTKFSFSEVRVGGAKNFLTVEAADEIYGRIKAGLHLQPASCRPGAKGGGICNARPASATHSNLLSVSVTQRSVKITLSSLPLAAATITANEQIASGLDAAYACFATADMASMREVHDCIQSSSNKLDKLPLQSRTQTAQAIRLDYPTLSCANVADYCEKGLSFVGRDTSLIPDCKLIAAVIERASSKPPHWAPCIDPRDDDAFFKDCVAGYSPSLVNPNRQQVASCVEVQKSYKVGVLRAQPDKKLSDVPAPDCDYVLAQTIRWRKVPETLKACLGYDPDNTAEHLMQCVSSERDFIRLKDCRGVQLAYEQRVRLANGYKPDDFYPLPCDQAEPLLAKAEQLREKRRKEAEEFARRMAEAKAIAEQARKDHVNGVQQAMKKKYADTPEGAASRTSALEKKIRGQGGAAPTSCDSPRVDGFYCPPTEEEVRLAMMRRHVQKTGLKMVNGHLLHGKLATGATVFLAMGGHPGKAMIGLELHYNEAKLIYECDRRTKHYECRFRLPFKTNYDELTQMYMDGLTSGSPFNVADFMFNLMDSTAATEDHAYKFRLDRDGLWRAEPTIEQELKDIREELEAIR